MPQCRLSVSAANNWGCLCPVQEEESEVQVCIPTQTWRSVAEKCSSPWCVSSLSVFRIHLLTQFILAKRPPPPRRQATPPSWSSDDAQNDGDDTQQAEEPDSEPDEQPDESDQSDQPDQSEPDHSDQSENEPEDADGNDEADDQMDVNPDAGETYWIPPREYIGLFPNGFPTPYQD